MEHLKFNIQIQLQYMYLKILIPVLNTYQPYISGIRTMAVTRNNWISQYLNSNFGTYPGRLSDNIIPW